MTGDHPGRKLSILGREIGFGVAFECSLKGSKEDHFSRFKVMEERKERKTSSTVTVSTRIAFMK